MQSSEDFMANDDRMIRETPEECKSPIPIIPQGVDLGSPHIRCEHETSVTILGTDKKSSYTECEDCGHKREVSLNRPSTRKYAIEVGGVRFPVKVAPANRMTMNSRVMHIDVGGIHIVVDHCKAPCLLFRSTNFSQAHEKDGFGFHDQGEIEAFGMPGPEDVYLRTGAFNPTFCSRSFENCACASLYGNDVITDYEIAGDDW
jgi:DNA-directed RNA polymerase subunit RPC12/RpoP